MKVAMKKKGKEVDSATINQLRESHPLVERGKKDKVSFDLRSMLHERNSAENERRNSNNNARYLRADEQRLNSIEEPLASSTPAPRRHTPEPQMDLAEIIEKHKETAFVQREKSQRPYHPPKGRQSFIPTQEEARRQDEKKHGGKRANDEKIAWRRAENEKRLQALKVKKMREDLEREEWKMFDGLEGPSPPRGRSPTIVLNRRASEEPEEVFGGPARRKQDPRPGTSTGSRPSGRQFRDFRPPRTTSDEEEEEEEKSGRSERSSRRGPPEIGGWEKEQEGERKKGKGCSKRKVVRREDAEDVEVVKKVNIEEEVEEEEEEERQEEQREEEEEEEGPLEEWGAEYFEDSERFEGEQSLRSGTMSQIRDTLDKFGLGPYKEMPSSVYMTVLGKALNERDEAMEEVTKKEKDDKRRKEKKKKRKEKRKEKILSDEDEEMEEEEKE